MKRLLRFRDAPRGYVLIIHTDTTKVLEDGSPDPTYVIRLVWGKTPPSGVSLAAYRNSIRDEAIRQADLHNTIVNPEEGTPLPGEGGDF